MRGGWANLPLAQGGRKLCGTNLPFRDLPRGTITRDAHHWAMTWSRASCAYAYSTTGSHNRDRGTALGIGIGIGFGAAFFEYEYVGRGWSEG